MIFFFKTTYGPEHETLVLFVLGSRECSDKPAQMLYVGHSDSPVTLKLHTTIV